VIPVSPWRQSCAIVLTKATVFVSQVHAAGPRQG
jgi:hypothetical protein